MLFIHICIVLVKEWIAFYKQNDFTVLVLCQSHYKHHQHANSFAVNTPSHNLLYSHTGSTSPRRDLYKGAGVRSVKCPHQLTQTFALSLTQVNVLINSVLHSRCERRFTYFTAILFTSLLFTGLDNHFNGSQSTIYLANTICCCTF